MMSKHDSLYGYVVFRPEVNAELTDGFDNDKDRAAYHRKIYAREQWEDVIKPSLQIALFAGVVQLAFKILG